MKRHVLSVLLSSASMIGVSSAFAYPMSEFDERYFVAPSVTSTASVTDPEVGQIVYDVANAGFYGKAGSGTWVNLNASAVATQVVYLKDSKSSGTAGGTCTPGSWQTRDLNTTENTQTWASLSANQFTLTSGTYQILARAPAYQTSEHKAKLRNVTDSSDTLIGSNAVASASYQANTDSVVMGVFTIASSKTFEIQHRCSATSATFGFGVANSYSVAEIYTTVEIRKLN